MSERYITVEIKYDDSDSDPQLCGGMSIKEISDEFEGHNEITSVAFYNALTSEEE